MVLTVNLFNFAPLIQLWAGICLLFFYENLFHVTPFENFVNKYEYKLNMFLQHYGELKEYPKPNYAYYWKQRIWPAIQCLACLLFCFSIILLLYIGINKDTIESEKFLFAISCWFFIFELLFLAGYKNHIFRTYWFPSIWVILGIIISIFIPKSFMSLFFNANLSCITIFFEMNFWMIFYEIIFGIFLYRSRKYIFFRRLWFRFIWIIIGFIISIIVHIHFQIIFNIPRSFEISIFSILTCFGGFFIVTFLMFRELWIYNKIVEGLKETQEIVEMRAKFITETNSLLKIPRKILIPIEAKIKHPIIKKVDIDGKVSDIVDITTDEKASVIEAINEYFREEILKVYYPYIERYMI